MRVFEGVAGCACCYNASEGKFVDMGAAFDGPVLENGMSIDDLVLCESCVKSAGAALGADSAQDEITRANVEAERLRGELDKLRVYNEKLEDTLAFKPVVERKARKAAA